MRRFLQGNLLQLAERRRQLVQPGEQSVKTSPLLAAIGLLVLFPLLGHSAEEPPVESDHSTEGGQLPNRK